MGCERSSQNDVSLSLELQRVCLLSVPRLSPPSLCTWGVSSVGYVLRFSHYGRIISADSISLSTKQNPRQWGYGITWGLKMIVGEDLILCRHLVLWLSGFRLKGYTDSELPKLNTCILCISSFVDASILTVSSEKQSRKCSFRLLFVRVLY